MLCTVFYHIIYTQYFYLHNLIYTTEPFISQESIDDVKKVTAGITYKMKQFGQRMDGFQNRMELQERHSRMFNKRIFGFNSLDSEGKQPDERILFAHLLEHGFKFEVSFNLQN